MKKFMSFLMAVILLAGCQKPSVTVDSVPQTTLKQTEFVLSPEKLSMDKVREIETAWQVTKGYALGPWYYEGNLYGVRYYGTFSGYDILFDSVSSFVFDAYTFETIGNEEFYHVTSFLLLTYRNGEFLSLQDAYKQGLISAENIAQLAQIHRKMEETIYPDNGVLTKYKKQDIEAAWQVKTGQLLGEWYDDVHGTNPQGVRYYATYNGYDILFVNIEAEPVAHTVANVEFKHETGFALYAHREGVLYKLADAYDRGFLTDTHIAYLLAIHQWYEQEVCGKENTTD